MADKQVTVAVPEERVPEFYAWFASFLTSEPGTPPPFGGRGRRGRRGMRRHDDAHAVVGRTTSRRRPGCTASWLRRRASCSTCWPTARELGSEASRWPGSSGSTRARTASPASSPGPAGTPGTSAGCCRSRPRAAPTAAPTTTWILETASLFKAARDRLAAVGALEERRQLARDFLGAVLDEKVRRLDPAAAHVACPRSPDVEDVAVERPERARAFPTARVPGTRSASPVGLVELTVDRRSRAVVLADRLNRARVLELSAVRRDHRLGIAAGLTVEPDRAQVVLEVGPGVAGDQPLGQRSRLGEEAPVPVHERQPIVRPRPHLRGRHDVEHRRAR